MLSPNDLVSKIKRSSSTALTCFSTSPTTVNSLYTPKSQPRSFSSGHQDCWWTKRLIPLSTARSYKLWNAGMNCLGRMRIYSQCFFSSKPDSLEKNFQSLMTTCLHIDQKTFKCRNPSLRRKKKVQEVVRKSHKRRKANNKFLRVFVKR